MNRVYAIQRVNSAYSGNIINLRRSSDSVTADFTMDTTNSFLVTASGGQTVSAWLGAATATVATWYDQSGNGRNLTQATTGIQPGFSTTTGVQLRSGKYMTFPDLVSITDVTFCIGYVQNAYLQGNSGLPWYLQDGIINNELPVVDNDWGLIVPGVGIFGLFTGGSSANSVINTNGLGTYAFMTATRSSSTGTITLYNGTGTGTVFTTTDTGSKSGQNPSYLGYNPAGGASYPANTNSDIASLFMFDDVKSTQFISTLATTFPTQIKPNLNYIDPVRFYITNLSTPIRFWTRPIIATGGTITTSGSDTIHTFTTIGASTFTVNSTVTCQVLIVAGGGAGGSDRGGGGGGGGIIYYANQTFTPGSYTITVGAGGVPVQGGAPDGNGKQGGNGGNSLVTGLTTAVGGGGGGGCSGQRDGLSGGSGGGGSQFNGAGTAGTATSGQGNIGGNGNESNNSAGGGGGAGAVGTTSGANGGNGGAGASYSITGTSQIYSSGGGGGKWTISTAGTFGTGGTGAGNGSATASTNGSDAIYYGCGGGGSGVSGYSGSPATCRGGNGYQGIIIISRPT